MVLTYRSINDKCQKTNQTRFTTFYANYHIRRINPQNPPKCLPFKKTLQHFTVLLFLLKTIASAGGRDFKLESQLHIPMTLSLSPMVAQRGERKLIRAKILPPPPCFYPQIHLHALHESQPHLLVHQLHNGILAVNVEKIMQHHPT
ncbi:unnamed protein product [Hymenolepis diminuta]|uniref:Uncharacterized protein n=1 Tax=Hymenolepis diminuta TaxID=6216 RepID=A0A0R3SND9_HYMDI|nr:unnamed protein product [Hymenolepis diminuta]